jgi:hypothetical protein
LNLASTNISFPSFAARHGAAFAIFALLAFLWLWDVLILDKSLSGFDIILAEEGWNTEYPWLGVHDHGLLDSPTAHQPFRNMEWSAFRQGLTPTFNPYIFSGTDWKDAGIGAFVTALPQVLTDTVNALDWVLWLRLTGAAFLMYLCALAFGANRMVAGFTGIAWAFNLHQLVWLQFPQHLSTKMWIPALFGLGFLLLKGARDRLSLLLFVTVNLIFATSGYHQIVLYTYLAFGLFFSLYIAFDRYTPWRERLFSWLLLHGLILVASIFWAVSMLVEASMINEGLRGAQNWRGMEELTGANLDTAIQSLLAFLPPFEEVKRLYNPFFYGGVNLEYFKNPHSNNVEYLGYAGVLTVTFALTSIALLTQPKQWPMFLAALVTFCVVVAAMYRSPLMSWFMLNIPLGGKGNFTRFITLELFFLCLFASWGLTWLSQQAENLSYFSKAICVVVCITLLIPTVGSFVGQEYPIATLLRPAVLLIGFLTFGIIFIVLARDKLGPWTIEYGLAAAASIILIADLYQAGAGLNTRLDNEYIFPTNSTLRYIQADDSVLRVAVDSQQNDYHSNVLSFYGIPEVSGYLTVLPNQYGRFMSSVAPNTAVSLNGIMHLSQPPIELLAQLNVKYLISENVRNDPLLEHLFFANNHHLYQLNSVANRAWCAETIINHENQEKALAAYASALGNTPYPAMTSRTIEELHPGACEVTNEEALLNGYRATVTASETQLAVLSYPYSARWSATVNGIEAEYFQVNGNSIGLKLSAGQNQIELQHRDKLIIFSNGGLILFALASCVLVWRRRDTFAGQLIMLFAVIIFVRTSTLIPGLQNDSIAERSAIKSDLPVLIGTKEEHNLDSVSTPLILNQETTFPLTVVVPNLRRIRILPALYARSNLDQKLEIEIKDPAGQSIFLKQFDGAYVMDSKWLTLDISQSRDLNGELTLEITLIGDIPEPVSLWLDTNGQATHQIFSQYSTNQ